MDKSISFKGTFCERFQCPEEAFEREALWRCFFPHSVNLAKLLYRRRPHWFETDLLIIRALGFSTSMREVRAEASFLRENYRRHGFRQFFNIRISGKRMISVGQELLGREGGTRKTLRKDPSV